MIRDAIKKKPDELGILSKVLLFNWPPLPLWYVVHYSPFPPAHTGRDKVFKCVGRSILKPHISPQTAWILTTGYLIKLGILKWNFFLWQEITFFVPVLGNYFLWQRIFHGKVPGGYPTLAYNLNHIWSSYIIKSILYLKFFLKFLELLKYL